MSYLLKNKRAGGKTVRQFAVGGTVLIFLCLLYFVVPRFANEKLFAVARPIWSAKDYVAELISSVWVAIESKEKLATENSALARELAGAETSLETLDAIKSENERLKELLGRPRSEKRLIAAVLERPGHSLYDTLVLDVGLQNGVAVGDKVVSGDFIIGTLLEVYGTHSKAKLFSSPGETLNVLIGDKGIETEAQGRGGGNFTVKLPKEITVKTGDLISAPSINSKFFGVVGSAEQTVSGTFQTILFHLPVNPYELNWVEVVK